MSTLWVIFELSVNLFEACSVIWLFHRKFKQKFHSLLPPVLYILVHFGYLTLYLFIDIPISDLLVGFIVDFIYLFIFLKGDIFWKLLWGILGIGTISSVATIVITFSPIIFNTTTMEILLERDITRFILILFCKLLHFIIFYIYIKINTILSIKNVKSTVIFFTITILLSLNMIFTTELGKELPAESPLQYAVFAITGISFASIILLFWLSNIFAKQEEEKHILQGKLQLQEMQEKYSSEIESLYKELSEWRHDMKNHLQSISGMIQEQSYKDTVSYIDNIVQTDIFSSYVCSTGYSSIDALISVKSTYAKSMGIGTDFKFDIPKDIRISEIDISTIFGNLLDNAIEACRKIPNDKNPVINFEAVAVKNNLMITTSNPVDGKLNIIDGIFKTTKKNGFHGLGLLSVDSVVHKYEGYVERDCKKNVFSTSILIPILSENELLKMEGEQKYA